MMFRPGRPLNPSRNSANVPSGLNPSFTLDAASQSFKIILNIVRATGIPVRQQQQRRAGISHHRSMDSESGSREISSTSGNMFMTQSLKYSNVRPFVTLSYRDKCCRSTTAEGSNPTWNEQLILQLSGSLSTLRDDLQIALYDEVIENQINDESSAVRSLDIYQRIQANWLGEYRVPIGALLKQQKFEGVSELTTPKILVGYKRPLLDNITSNAEANIIVEIKEAIQIYFYLSMEPGFELPTVNTSSLECSELLEVRQNLAEWSLNVKELKPERFIEPLVCTEEGKRVCMTRLLEPIPLPVESSDNLIDSACRYAMLINRLKYYDACLAFNGVFLNNQVVLDTTYGSAKDIGILLCNYLLALGLQCWLVLGLANPYGETTFVLYRSEQGNLQLIDPFSGKRYFVKDVLCPLFKIFYVLSPDNIFCNIQSEVRVTMTNFNFNDGACWLAAFSKRNPAPLGGVQKLNYAYHDTLNINELIKNIERKVMKKINSWRTMRKTIWNRAFQPRLKTILQDLEYKVTYPSSATSYEDFHYADQLAAEFPGFKLYGFTLNFSYTNLKSISDRIRSTGIHLNSDKNVEFSVAVHVHPYPNNVLSVWLFLLSVVPN